MQILVTGASGFVGAALCRDLHERGFDVRGAVRSMHSSFSASGIESVAVGNLDASTDWSTVLPGVDCVIHCAARAHVMHETEVDALAAYRSVNVDGSQRLAEQAAALGVRRFVFLSSIKVNGEQTAPGAQICVKGSPRFARDDEVNPEDPYGVSKWEAEQALWVVSAQTGLEVLAVRPPLVCGPGVKGNLLRLLRWVARGVPLPLGAVHNQRSLVGLDNLVDLLIHCIDHPNASGKIFLASDGKDLSTPKLIKLIASSMGTKANLFPLPISILKFLASIFGKKEEINRLVGSLRVDNSYTKQILNWTPPIVLKMVLKEWFKKNDSYFRFFIFINRFDIFVTFINFYIFYWFI